MPVVGISGTTFFSLDPSGPDERLDKSSLVPRPSSLVPRPSELRLLSIFVRGSRGPTSRPDSGILMSRRSAVDWLSVREDLSVPPVRRPPGATDSPREGLLSPSPATLWDDGSIREPDSSRGKRRLSACCLVEVETDGVLLLIKSPMRERDWSRFNPELTAEGLPACPPEGGLACCSFLEMRERRSELRVWEFEPAVLSDVSDLSDLSDPVVIKPPIRDFDSREFEPAAPAWPPAAMPDCAAVGADGRLKSLDLRVTISDFRFSIDNRESGVRVLIELPIREVRSELIRPLEFVFPARLPALRPDLVSRASCPRFEGGTPSTRLEDGGWMLDEIGAREVAAGLEFMPPGLRVDPNVLGRDCIEVPGLTTLLELVGGCTDRDWLGGLTTLSGAEGMLLGGRLIGAELVRPMDGGLAGARLTLGGALTLGAGAGAGAGLAA